jgi:GNAT superfamily N-acetyltransferase
MRWAGPREEDLFASLGEDPEVIRRRRGRGDMAAVVVRGGRLVAHVWCRRGSYDEQGMIVQLGEREAWLYDGFVAPDRRGEGIYPALVRAVSAALAAAGVDRLLSGIDHLNQPSLRSARSRGAVAIGSITMVRVLGLSVRREDWFGSVRYHVHRGTAPLVIPPRADSRRRPVPMRGRSD